MFNSKQEKLFDVGSNKKQTSDNPFLSQGLKKGAETTSGNGALKYSTTGNDFVDQFANIGKYKEPRTFEEISKDAHLLYSQDREKAIKFTLYMRIITRKTKLIDGSETEEVQRGAGLKHESIMRFMWLYTQDADAFAKYLPLFIAVGSWRDLIEMLRYDLIYHGWDGRVLDWNIIGKTIVAGLENENTSELIKKYIPQLKAKSKCTTIRAQAGTVTAKWLANNLGLSYKEYRKMKSSGTAHEWQKLISNKLYDSIDFNSIHGRALMQLVSSKFIVNNKLEEKYEAWIEAQPIAKFTGYPHELFEKYKNNTSSWSSTLVNLTNIKSYQKTTINKQFDGLVELGKTGVNTQSNLIVVRDTSASMNSEANGSTMSCGDIAKSLALYFSEFLNGPFKNHWIEFDNGATMKEWKGDTVVERWINDNSSYVGGTNFMSVIKLLINIKSRGVDEKYFPTGILCISDGEFNRTSSGATNFAEAKRILRHYGFSKEYIDNFKLVLWDLRNGYYGNRNVSFESHGETENMFYFSGYDASIVAFLLGKEQRDENQNVQTPKTDVELFDAAMDQEILNYVK